MLREPSSPASMRTWVRSRCHSSTGASARRLTSIGGFVPDIRPRTWKKSANDQIDELAGHDDLLDDLLAVEPAAHVLALPRGRQQLLLRGLGGDLDPVAELAVDLDDEGHGVARQ